MFIRRRHRLLWRVVAASLNYEIKYMQMCNAKKKWKEHFENISDLNLKNMLDIYTIGDWVMRYKLNDAI